ncbi:MAG: V-type ATP synthase subunit E [Archaeoglobaceae archaeon]|nr:V-type ATP synthase subunit E [Archaeoglobaceae archaeon]MCX8152470.1 V-type ATP synthase subunit E [Archaeoglobaceae archaeon]MDW8013810.1 V-type ATP synthase subunit E [Archaeoglobaceae archaeon]
MPLEPVLEEIVKKGEEVVKKIMQETETEVNKILMEAKEEAKKILEKTRSDTEKEIDALRRQEISSLNLELKRALLNKQKEIVEQVFSIVKQRILEMNAETKKKLLKNLISKNAKAGMKIYCRKGDEDIVKSLLKELKLNVVFAGNIDCLGGVVLEDPRGEIRINLTFDQFFSRVYEQKMSEVSKILFG